MVGKIIQIRMKIIHFQEVEELTQHKYILFAY